MEQFIFYKFITGKQAAKWIDSLNEVLLNRGFGFWYKDLTNLGLTTINKRETPWQKPAYILNNFGSLPPIECLNEWRCIKRDKPPGRRGMFPEPGRA